jgi:hypothetical protein
MKQAAKGKAVPSKHTGKGAGAAHGKPAKAAKKGKHR